MSRVDEFDGMSISGGVGALDTGRPPARPAPPALSAAGAKARRGHSEAPGEQDVMVRALRKESADPETRTRTMQSEAAPEDSVGADDLSPADAAGPQSGQPVEPPDAPVGWSWMLVQVLAIAVVAAGITLVALKVSGLLRPSQVRVVTFDVLKYENAERAQAMKLMGQGGAGAVAPMLSYVSKRLHTAIERAAGPGTLVVLSQAVVQGQTRDITDRVLKELGLPTQVPTATAVKSPSIGPSTMAPPVTANPSSPLSRLLESDPHTKKHSIIP